MFALRDPISLQIYVKLIGESLVYWNWKTKKWQMLTSATKHTGLQWEEFRHEGASEKDTDRKLG